MDKLMYKQENSNTEKCISLVTTSNQFIISMDTEMRNKNADNFYSIQKAK